MTQITTPQLYVSTYKKYNEGSISGEWVDLTQFSDADAFLEHCAELHSDEEDPEFMFQDFEGFPRAFYSESASVSDLEKLFDFLSMDEDERKLVEMYAEASGNSIEDCTLDDANDAFHGTADSEADFAEQIAEETGAIPSDIPSWIVIDWEATWNCNLRYDYNTATDEDGTIYFFLNH